MYKLPVPVVLDREKKETCIVYEDIYEMHELSYLGKMLKCNDSYKRGVRYLEIPCAFDIETTNMYVRTDKGNIAKSPRPYSFMYHWQFCLDDQVVFGRRWEEFQELVKMLQERMHLDSRNRLVIFVHNLSFEFQFMRRFLNITGGFYAEERKPLKVIVDDCIEFRDSYVLSNMNLQKFCENERNVRHYKLSGDAYDYSKRRTADTFMTDEEKAYCYNDVRGLCECIRSRMNEYTLADMPMTSTGYVRRECRIDMQKNKKNRQLFIQTKLDEKLYNMCRGAFRGGDTHANGHYADQTLNDVDSFDITSSYPANMMMDYFPTTAFTQIKTDTYILRDMVDYCAIMRVRLVNAHYIGVCGIPYIALSKCDAVSNEKDRVIDNGRIRHADYIEMTITNIDLYIIAQDYAVDKIYFSDIYVSRKGLLPEELRGSIMKYYRLKTELKNVDGKEYEYNRSKNKLNAIYGMSVMRIDQSLWRYEDGKFIEDTPTLAQALDDYYRSRNSFLSYQWGVFVTANSRLRLREMLWAVGRDVVYCDTDSIKCIGNHRTQFEAKNAQIIKRAKDMGAYAEDRNGRTLYLGTWDHEASKRKYHDVYPTYTHFRTLGAKKYVIGEWEYDKKEDKDSIVYNSTIAGVNKKAGAKFFNEHGIDAFTIDTVIENSGHLVAYYNDDDIHTIVVDNCEMTTASNIALVDDTYTIGVTDDYLDLIEKALENEDIIIYI